jgi:hypothetical protein
MDISQTSWRQFGCCVAASHHTCFSTVTMQQRRHFVPRGSAFFCRQNDYLPAVLSLASNILNSKNRQKVIKVPGAFAVPETKM